MRENLLCCAAGRLCKSFAVGDEAIEIVLARDRQIVYRLRALQ